MAVSFKAGIGAGIRDPEQLTACPGSHSLAVLVILRPVPVPTTARAFPTPAWLAPPALERLPSRACPSWLPSASLPCRIACASLSRPGFPSAPADTRTCSARRRPMVPNAVPGAPPAMIPTALPAQIDRRVPGAPSAAVSQLTAAAPRRRVLKDPCMLMKEGLFSKPAGVARKGAGTGTPRPTGRLLPVLARVPWRGAGGCVGTPGDAGAGPAFDAVPGAAMVALGLLVGWVPA
jgi:hypothetical protein